MAKARDLSKQITEWIERNGRFKAKCLLFTLTEKAEILLWMGQKSWYTSDVRSCWNFDKDSADGKRIWGVNRRANVGRTVGFPREQENKRMGTFIEIVTTMNVIFEFFYKLQAFNKERPFSADLPWGFFLNFYDYSETPIAQIYKKILESLFFAFI